MDLMTYMIHPSENHMLLPLPTVEEKPAGLFIDRCISDY